MKVFPASRAPFSKSMTLVQSLEFGMLVVVDMCCVLSCPVAGFLLIVGVGGENPMSVRCWLGGIQDMLNKTTSHANTMRKHRKSGGFWDRKHKTGRAGDQRITPP